MNAVESRRGVVLGATMTLASAMAVSAAGRLFLA
jgi:hypothetical protein